MRFFSIPTLVVITALAISACGARNPQAEPTIESADLQGTIAAAAFTVIAETQAAIPTATPVPPTATSTATALPTLTLLPLPTLAGTLTPVPGVDPGSDDPCIHKTLPETLQGDPIRMRLNNSTKVALSVTVYLNQTGPQGVCGYRSYKIEPGQFIVLNDLVEGCYTLWAWNPDPDQYFIVTNGTSCLDDSAPWAFDISTSSIKLGT